jgi:hypothetical protein
MMKIYETRVCKVISCEDMDGVSMNERHGSNFCIGGELMDTANSCFPRSVLPTA